MRSPINTDEWREDSEDAELLSAFLGPDDTDAGVALCKCLGVLFKSGLSLTRAPIASTDGNHFVPSSFFGRTVVLNTSRLACQSSLFLGIDLGCSGRDLFSQVEKSQIII